MGNLCFNPDFLFVISFNYFLTFIMSITPLFSDAVQETENKLI